MTRVTSSDVARLAGVSQSTVSRALRHERSISSATIERVTAAADMLGYVVSDIGRSLVTRTNNRVGVVVGELTNPFYPNLIDPVFDSLKSAGYGLTLIVQRESDDAEESSKLYDGSLDGAILCTATSESEVPAQLIKRRIPFVFLNRSVPHVKADASVPDNRGGAKLAATHLAALGHSNIAAVIGPKSASTAVERESGYRDGLAEYGLVLPDRNIVRGPYSIEAGRLGLRALLEHTPSPTAVLCGNDVIALGVHDEATRIGLRVPQDLSIVGFDDIPFASLQAFQLTTIRVDLQTMARTAVHLLHRRIQGATASPESVLAEMELIVRSSTQRVL